MIMGQVNKKRPYMDINANGGVISDKSLNQHSLTNSNITIDSGPLGESNGSILFNSTTDEITGSSALGQQISALLNSGATFYIYHKWTINTGGRLFNQINFSNLSFSTGISALPPYGYYFFTTNTVNQINGTLATGGIEDEDYWKDVIFLTKDEGSTNFKEIVDDLTSIWTDSSVPKNRTNDSASLRVGRRGDGSQNYQGNVKFFRVYEIPIPSSIQRLLRKHRGRIKV